MGTNNIALQLCYCNTTTIAVGIAMQYQEHCIVVLQCNTTSIALLLVHYNTTSIVL